MRRRRAVHQLVVGASPGDAIYDQALVIQKALQTWGYESRIYACHLHSALEERVFHYTRYRARSEDVVLWHYSIGSELSAFVRGLKCPVVMIYHNVTPLEYLQNVSSEMARLVQQGRAELADFRDIVRLALAVSEFNCLELEAAGYSHTGVLPIVLDEARYGVPSNPALLSRYDDEAVNLLFVGRIAPNKRQDDVIKVFYCYHHIQPSSRLFLVGQAWDPAEQYRVWLERLVNHLGLTGLVHLTGHVSFEDLVTYYRLADVFVSMSEHEGFGKPLIESMYFNVPVVAYAAAAVPYTLGDAGVLVHRKDHEVIAELINLIVTDEDLRGRLLAGQQARFQAFRQESMLKLLGSYLQDVL
jgi:glycosyltransferase involved in cell wall biosynthesis